MAKVVIATTTFYTKEDYKLRFRLAIDTIRQAKLRSFPIVVLDVSPDPYVSKAFKKEGAEVISKKKCGFGDGVRAAIQKAAELSDKDGVIIWQEPEKSDFVRFCKKAASIILNGKARIVVPERTLKSLATYPIEQAHSEQFSNLCIQSITGEKYYDYYFGPKLYRKDMVPFILSYKGKLWDAHMIPVIRALKQGNIVDSVAVDYQHPKEQKKAEQGNWHWNKKRLFQLSYLLPIVEKEWGGK